MTTCRSVPSRSPNRKGAPPSLAVPVSGLSLRNGCRVFFGLHLAGSQRTNSPQKGNKLHFANWKQPKQVGGTEFVEIFRPPLTPLRKRDSAPKSNFLSVI